MGSWRAPGTRARLPPWARIWYAARRWEGMRTTRPLRDQLFQRPESFLESGRLIPIQIRPAPKGSGSGNLSDNGFDTSDIDAMLTRLEELRSRHRELDTTIEELEKSGADDIRVMALKREKLRVKDKIVWLSSRITPDIIA
mgnify:CR=1 FL=1